MKLTIILVKIFLFTLLSSPNLYAQVTSSKIDYTGYIKKYDTLFNGIGPQVYFVPSPPTKQDSINEMTEALKKIKTFDDTIKEAILYQNLLTSFDKTENTTYITHLIKSNSLQSNNWSSLVYENERIKNYADAIGFLNEFAEQLIIQKRTVEAEQLLLKGIDIASKQKRFEDKSTLQSNLTSLYLYNKKFINAKKSAEEHYKQAQKGKSLTNQGKSLVNLAVAQAFANEANAAENTIIRKAIPIFNRTKDYDNKINAWVKLAQIYTLNNRYTEAQWFLIQAQELAEINRIRKYNTTIEYLLGSSKFHQNNLIVSKKELINALDLAKEAGYKHIQLATTQILVEINLKQKNVNEAEFFFNSYWTLRNELF